MLNSSVNSFGLRPISESDLWSVLAHRSPICGNYSDRLLLPPVIFLLPRVYIVELPFWH
jgi:hypothetical protein